MIDRPANLKRRGPEPKKSVTKQKMLPHCGPVVAGGVAENSDLASSSTISRERLTSVQIVRGVRLLIFFFLRKVISLYFTVQC